MTFLFEKELNATLQLEVDGKQEIVVSSHLSEITINAYSYGFQAIVTFIAFENEEIHQLFAKEKDMKASLLFKSTDFKNAGTPLLEIKGIVNKKSYQPGGDPANKSSARLYTVHFEDAAKISWGEHSPCKIFVDQSMKEVIEGEKNPLISIKFDWDLLNEISPILALPMNENLTFYSFLMWYLHRFNGILEYDYKANNYAIVGKKKADGKPTLIPELGITPAICQYPESPRYLSRMIKHTADSLDNTDEENPNGFQAVRKDVFDESAYRHFPEQASLLVHSKPFPEKPLIRFDLATLSELFGLEQITPGTLIEIKGDLDTGGTWCEDSIFKGQVFRITNFKLHATQLKPSEITKMDVQPYNLSIEVVAESKDELFVSRPTFHPPAYPFFLPGKIFSEIGDKEQTTFNIAKHEKAPLGQYLVKVPLVEGDKKVAVPFTPDLASGQHYFPYCKDQQVMLAIYFQTAKIERVLDWQPLTRPPLETQANQVVFASNGKDKFTVQKHEFQNGKDSIFTITQSSSENQTQTVQIKEKVIGITVVEKGKSTIHIQLNRDSGLTLEVKDEGSGVTQQTTYAPEAITHTSKGKDGTSTFVQKPNMISIDCKQFTLKCEEGTIEANKTMTYNAKSKIFVKAPIVNLLDKIKMGS